MSTESALSREERRNWPQTLPIYYGWINVLVASAAMTATLAGRTHGLGLVTEPLVRDLQIDHLLFARINLFASLAGAAFCLPVGWLIDRYGVRGVLFGVTLALGLATLGMSAAVGPVSLATTLVFVRGFGQSALSIVAMAAIGKWFRRRLGAAMGLFAVLLTFGFIASVLGMGSAVEQLGWREAWRNLGLAVLLAAPVFGIFARSTPESCGIEPDEPILDLADGAASYSLTQALATPAFWVLLFGTSAFNLVWSGVTLFNESMLIERGLDRDVSVQIMAILTGVGLLANLIGGALASRVRVVRVLGGGLICLAAGLALFPTIHDVAGARLYALAIGLSGGIVTVVFFAAWGQLFGRAELGRIQGAAQLATVLASAAGPLVMAQGLAWSGSYTLAFHALAIVVGLLAVAAMVVSLPAQHPLEKFPS